MRKFSSVGERLKELRDIKDVNQDVVAKQLNVKRQTYSSYETNGSMPNIDNLRKMAVYFNVSSDFLIGLTEQPNPAEVYTANNIHESNIIHGISSVTIGDNSEISKEETEILRIYNELDVRSRTKLLNYAFELEDENNLKTHDTQSTTHIAQNAARNGGEPTTEAITQEELDTLMNAKPQTY